MAPYRQAAIFAFAVLIAQAAAVCYLEDTSQTCSVCWKTTYSSPDDKVGVTMMSECPANIKATYDVPPPEEMFDGKEYPVTFSVQVDRSAVAVLPGTIKKGEPEVADVPHANVHSCIASRGACTPFVSNTPGLSTHTPATYGGIDATGKGTFEGNVKLDVDTYIIIAHIRFFVANALDSSLPKTKYDVAVGLQREVVKVKREISTDAYIMAGVVGFILIVFSTAILYMVKKRILDLDRIMAMLFSDSVTLPVDVVCGLADVAAFTISCTMVLEDDNLLSVVPICWLFCGVAWVVSIYTGINDIISMKHLWEEKHNTVAFEQRMTVRLSGKWLQRRPSQAAGVGKADKKDLMRKLSEEMQNLTGNSDAHHEAMVDFDRADRDFHKRKRTIMGILLEGIPITALQTYILIEGQSVEMVAVLALLLAALLLGTSMQGLGDYGNAKKRREEALARFESLFAGNFEQTTAGKKHEIWQQAKPKKGDVEAAPNGMIAPPSDSSPRAQVAVVVVGAEQFGTDGESEEIEAEEGGAGEAGLRQQGHGESCLRTRSSARAQAVERGWPVRVAEALRHGSLAKVSPI